jgi:hypothetical protein
MITVKYYGRLGNQIFQYIAASIFSEKHNLYLDFQTEQLGGYRNLSLLLKHISGENKNEFPIVEINDFNFLEYLNRDSIEPCHYIFNGFFQLRDFIINYENEILKKFLYLNSEKKDGFVIHLRMDDIVNYVGNLDYNYYKTCIEKINKTKGYIITDDPDSELTKKLIKDFDLELYHKNEYDDLIFATKFDNIILSQGTYSFWIGFFGQSKNIYYSTRPPVWHGDIFLDNWNDVYKK